MVSLARLREAFLIEDDLKAHPITGEVRVGGTLFLVPKEQLFKGRRVRIGLDPEAAHAPFLVLGPGVYEPLAPAFPPPAARPVSDSPSAAPEPIGPLTPLLEQYRGRTLPQARGGFGLPEIYDAFAQAMGRPVPHTEAEAALVLEWLAQQRPLRAPRLYRRLGQGPCHPGLRQAPGSNHPRSRPPHRSPTNPRRTAHEKRHRARTLPVSGLPASSRAR